MKTGTFELFCKGLAAHFLRRGLLLSFGAPNDVPAKRASAPLPLSRMSRKRAWDVSVPDVGIGAAKVMYCSP